MGIFPGGFVTSFVTKSEVTSCAFAHLFVRTSTFCADPVSESPDAGVNNGEWDFSDFFFCRAALGGNDATL